MRSIRSRIPILILTLWLILTLPALAEENLLVNGDFSETIGTDPAGWTRDMWYTDPGVSQLSVSGDGFEGKCILVENNSANDARFAQTVFVEPNTLYRISCMCRAESVGKEKIGANISIEGTFSYSPSVTETGGEWVKLEMYGRTGEDQNQLTVFARVGGYSNENSGRAWFDNFEMERVDDVPEGTEVLTFAPVSQNSSQSDADEDAEPPRNTETFVLLTCIYMLAVLAVAKKHRRSLEKSPEFYRRAMIALTLVALALRLILAAKIPGYHTDINCFTAWAGRMASVGPARFYSEGWCDYPPLYMWMLAPVGAIQSLLNLSFRTSAQLVLLKLWPILFDIAAAWLVWRRASKTLGSRPALLLAAFFALNPAVFTDSAAWGQIDSVFTLLVALCALSATEGRYVPSLVSFAVAMLIKPQALLFAPIGLFFIVVTLIRGDEKPVRALAATLIICACAALTALFVKMGQTLAAKCFGVLDATAFIVCAVYAFMPGKGTSRKPLRRFILGLVSALGIIYAVALISCFEPSQGFLHLLTAPGNWLKNLYTETMSGSNYDKFTINALNLYTLFDLNWKSLSSDSTMAMFAWGLFALSYVYCAVLCVFAKDKKHLPLIGGALIMLICAFGPMIHERYVYPAILLLILGYIYARDKRILISLTVLSATLFLNEILVLQGGMTEANFGHIQDSEVWINSIVSIAAILNALFTAWVALDICVFGNLYPLIGCDPETRHPARRDLLGKANYKLHLNRKDAILMAAVTLAYSIVAFTNLGSTKAPQTTWTSAEAGDQVVFDLGETRSFRMTYYGNICSSNFTVELSNDGERWTESYYTQYDQGEIFRWLWYTPRTPDGAQAYGDTVPTQDGSAYVTFPGYDGESQPFQTARYVRITSVAAGLKLCEVGFLNEDGTPWDIAGVSGDGNVTLLIDEQDTIPAVPSWYNSTYFDEIYHARTAYEHLHGLNTYEWTHPPLGKVLMMVGIQLFGMTPFGWRFMGALMGVLMVPLMYLLVKQLTKSTKLSFIAMFLLSVDAMHFTQTRIATIDSYSVFWIMLMYLFMFRYCQMPWNSRGDFRRSLVPLGLCGVTMGIAWATKWIGLYASAGLAVLFFWSLWQRWRTYRLAQSLEPTDEATSSLCASVRETFWPAAGITIAFCVLFFVIIPVLIYYFSYYWYLVGAGMTSFGQMFTKEQIQKVVDLQSRIFNYHAGLGGDTHYFRSPWYQWPIIWWPMWYYSGSAYMPEGMVSSISCMGNPAVWWFGLIALIFVVVKMCVQRRAPRTCAMVVIGFASQFLPWVLVPRSTFIYHYFASVPFIIMASVLMLKQVCWRSPKAFKILSILLMAAALGLFIAFYPLESGMPVARSYAMYLRWFKWYNF